MADEDRPGSTAGCLLQLFWTLVGPGLLLAMGAILIVNRPPLGAWPDYAFLGGAAAVCLARLLDRTPPDATAGGGASSRLMYVVILAAVALLIFLIAHFVTPGIL